MCRQNITVISLTTLTAEQQKFIRNEHVLLKLNSLLPNAYLKCCNASFKLFYMKSEDSKILTDNVESQISMTKKPLNSDMVNILQSNKGQKFLSDLIAASDKTHICPSVKVDAENELLLMLGPKGTIYSLEKDIDRFLKFNQVFVKETSRVQHDHMSTETFAFSESLDLNEEELSILEKSELLLDLKKTYKAITIKFEHEKNIVIIQANLKNEIQEIILEILKMCRQNITVISLTTLTAEQQKFIRNEHVLLKLNSLLPNAYLKCCNASFKLFYMKSEDSKILTDIVESQISMTKKPLNSDMVNILQSNKGQKFLSDLIAASDKTHICPSVKEDAENELLLMLGPKGTIYSLEKDIDRFLKFNQVFVKEIPFSLGKQHFVGRFLQEELNEIKQNIVEVEIIHLSNQYVVKGLKDPVEECYNKLTNLSSKIKHDEVKLKYHGIQEFLQDQEVKRMIKEVEEKNNCVITEGTEYDSSDTYLNQATVPESLDLKAKANSDGTVTVNFMLGNILELKVDALVNPLNSTLKLTCGLSKAILRKENGLSSEIVLTIYSQDLKNIKTATWDIESFCKKNYKEISEKDDPTAKRLTKDQVKLLEQFGVQQRVNVSIKIDEGIFKLQGFNVDGIYQLQKKMQSLVLEAMEHQHKTIQKSLPSAIVWQFKSGSKWIKYEPLLNSDLEQHYNMKANLLDDDDSTMERYEIQRVDLSKEGESLPTDWSPMKDNADLKVIELKAESSEYKKVEKQVIDTNGNIQIKKILRIQNKTLYQQYAVKKRDLLNQNPKGHQNELQLFHGTAHTAVPKINVHGFNRSYCWINGTMYGKGVYFHKHASLC
ncbi:hypothetical protein Btru_004403 [Bulinus truncatus]|nr:hypothetical protein Btru_004403 [Bulinus truncatus]